MESMETRCDTMFDIVQNLAKEVLEFKNTNNEVTHQHLFTQQSDENAYDTLDTNLTSGIANVTYDAVTNMDDVSDASGSDDDSDDDTDDDSENDDNSDASDDENGSVNLDVLDVDDTFDNGNKINISDDSDDNKIRVIDLNDPDVIHMSPTNEEHLDKSIFIDEDDDAPIELNLDNQIEINKVSNIESDDEIDDEDDEEEDDNDDLEENDDSSTSKPSKSALRKLKIAQLKQMATDNQIEIDDSMIKKDIIELLLAK